MLQEKLHAAHMRAEAAEQEAAHAQQLEQQLADLEARQKMWDQVLQVTQSTSLHHILLFKHETEWVMSDVLVPIHWKSDSLSCILIIPTSPAFNH